MDESEQGMEMAQYVSINDIETDLEQVTYCPELQRSERWNADVPPERLCFALRLHVSHLMLVRERVSLTHMQRP